MELRLVFDKALQAEYDRQSGAQEAAADMLEGLPVKCYHIEGDKAKGRATLEEWEGGEHEEKT